MRIHFIRQGEKMATILEGISFLTACDDFDSAYDFYEDTGALPEWFTDKYPGVISS